MKTIIGILAAILGIALIVGLYNGSFWLQRDVSTRSQNIDTAVFHQTQGYVDGKVEIIEKLHREWNEANASDRPALKLQILQESDRVDHNLLPSQTRSFVESL